MKKLKQTTELRKNAKLPARSKRPHNPSIKKEQIVSYLDHLSGLGRAPDTLKTYKRSLNAFYVFLPPNKQLSPEIITRWRKSLTEQGYTARTISTYTVIANGFLDYIGLREYQCSHPSPPASSDDPQEITRREYLRLLSTARALENERVYLLVKVFAVLGMKIQELPRLTCTAVQNGHLIVRGRECEASRQYPQMSANGASPLHSAGGPACRPRLCYTEGQGVKPNHCHHANTKLGT